jgi:hypothetical protein
MREQHNSEDQTAADDPRNITPPNPTNQTDPGASSENWVMPKPVFRRSGGHDPLAIREKFELFEDTTAVPNKVQEEASELAAARRTGENDSGRPNPDPTVVEPQPDLLESFAEPPVQASVGSAERPKGGSGRIITVLLVIIASLAAIAIFLFIVTYLFLSKNGNGSF